MVDYELFIIGLVPKAPAFISFISSCYVMYEIIFSPARRSVIHYRLLLSMNLCTGIVACCQFVGTWAIPRGTPFSYNAIGNETSCNLQGSLLSICGLAIQHYYASLAVISYVSVMKSFKGKFNMKVEPFIHLWSLLYPIVLAAIALQNEYVNPAGAWCWIDSNPSGCGSDVNVDCIHEVNGIYIHILTGTLYILTTLTVIMMILIYRKIRFDEKHNEQDDENREEQQKKSKVLLIQIALYIFSYGGSYITIFIVRLIQWKTGVLNIPLYGAGIFLVSSQGFFNLIVYILLKSIVSSENILSYSDSNIARRTEISSSELSTTDVL